VQLRDKHGSTRRLIEEARAIKAMLQSAGTPLLINDRVDVALAAGAEGVHVGWDDMDPREARRLLGPQAIIGLSIKNRAQVEAAPLDALDYVCVGGVFATTSKDNPDPPIGLAGFRQLANEIRARQQNLPVGAIAGIGSLGASVGAAIKADARVLLGGDVQVQLVHREATGAERQFLDGSGAVSEVALLSAMAVSPDGAHRTLIELRAVDAAYPLYDKVELDPAQDLAAALAARDGVYGAVAEPGVAERLGLKPGDSFKIGTATVQLRASVERAPDAALSGLAFGPRVTIAVAALGTTGLIQPGSLIHYEYRVRLPRGADPTAWARQARVSARRSAGNGPIGMRRRACAPNTNTATAARIGSSTARTSTVRCAAPSESSINPRSPNSASKAPTPCASSTGSAPMTWTWRRERSSTRNG